jgi:Zn-dependent M28 family amino/carboxypeptidase
MRALFISALRVIALAAAIFFCGWWFMIRMPGRNIERAASLSAEDLVLRAELVADVQELAGNIGERNVPRYPALLDAGEFIEKSFREAGLEPRRDSYEVRGRQCHNIEAEIRAASPEIILVGAHYDSVYGAPGANDNASGVAGLLALARRFAGKQNKRTMRFVAFVNEEPPYFQTEQMGSLVYARRCRARHDPIEAMISLETIGYFSDAPGSQRYPSPVLGAFYPTTGNFIGVVGNVGSRDLVRKTIKIFRQEARLPSQGAALPPFIPGVGWSDQWSFWQNGYAGIMITDTAPFRYPDYHAFSDTPEKLDYDRFALVVSGMQKVLTVLAREGR